MQSVECQTVRLTRKKHAGKKVQEYFHLIDGGLETLLRGAISIRVSVSIGVNVAVSVAIDVAVGACNDIADGPGETCTQRGSGFG